MNHLPFSCTRTRRAALSGIGSALLLLAIPSCNRSESDSDPRSGGSDGSALSIVATTGMIGDIAQQVAGDLGEVTTLMGPGVDPHLYKPTPGDITKLQKADLILYNGLHLEGKMAELFERMEANGKSVVAVTNAVGKDKLIDPGDDSGYADPHLWGDVDLWGGCAQPIIQAIATAAPDEAARTAVLLRGSEVVNDLDQLHKWAEEQIESIPAEGRILITSHDAFAYLGRAYGIEVIGIQGISTVSEAGLADMTKAVELIKERGVRALFVESSVSPATIERISKDAGVRIGGELFSDAMGEPGEMETIDGVEYDLGTYEGMIRHNIHTIASALREPVAAPE